MKTGHDSAIVILGMHRSGTSCLAGCLEERGLYLGDVANASANNPRGNKENRRIWVLNEDVLAASGGSWDRPPSSLAWNDSHRQRRDDIIESCSAAAHWGFKDPRTIVTLPFWTEALPDMRLVATFRHPAAVARSLMKRKGLQPAMPPLELWKHYNRLLLRLTGSAGIPLLCFDWPPEVYASSVDRVAGGLGLRGGDGASFDFFDDGIRSRDRSKTDEAALDDDAESIYRSLRERSDAWR